MLSVINSYNQSEYFIPISKCLEKSPFNKVLEIGKIYFNKIGENYTFLLATNGKSDGRIAGSALDNLVDGILDHITAGIARSFAVALEEAIVTKIFGKQ